MNFPLDEPVIVRFRDWRTSRLGRFERKSGGGVDFVWRGSISRDLGGGSMERRRTVDLIHIDTDYVFVVRNSRAVPVVLEE